MMEQKPTAMINGKMITETVLDAIASGAVPEDIAQDLQQSIEVFKADTSLFDSAGLKGPLKHAEMMIKLGFWLAAGQLKVHEFRIWAACVPPHDNQGWDVDLLYSRPGSSLRNALKMGPIYTNPEACLVQEPADLPAP